MAKIILRASLASTTFLVTQKVIEIPLGSTTTPNDVEMSIDATSGGIDKDDFSVGLLPEEVRSIRFIEGKSSKNIIAIVSFREIKTDQQSLVIELPITGFTRVTTNSVKLIERSPIDNNMISSSGGYNTTSSKFEAATSVVDHVVVGDLGQTVDVLTRSFTVPNGFRFSKEPSYKIKPSGLGYTVVSNTSKNTNGSVSGKVFTVKHTFPELALTGQRVDSIDFSYKLKAIKNDVKFADKKEDYKIYSIDTGRDVGPEGGLKVIVVKGVPGSPFKIQTQDSLNRNYDFKTGDFGGGSFLEGIIPSARPGFSYGEYRVSINVPASTSGGVVTSKLSATTPVNHTKLVEAFKNPLVRADINDAPKEVKDEQTHVSNISVSVRDGGEASFKIGKPIFTIDKPTDANVSKEHPFLKELGPLELSGNYTTTGVIGKEILFPFLERKGEVAERKNTLRFVVFCPDDGKFIRINRFPRFSRREKYTRASENVGNTPYKDSVNGDKILTDVGVSVRNTLISDTSDGTTVDFGKHEVEMRISVVPLGDSHKHGVVGDFPDRGLAYKGIGVSVQIKGGYGDAKDLDLQINANNFLTLVDLT